MDSISISDFKATCIAVIDRVRETGRPVTITRRGKPIGQIVPPPRGRKKLQYMEFEEMGDLVAPLPIEDWGSLASIVDPRPDTVHEPRP